MITSRSTRPHGGRSLCTLRTVRNQGAVALLCLVAGLTGCSKKDEKKSSAKSTKSEQESDTTETSAAVKPPQPNIPDEQIPTEEDYEAEVEKQIKADSNLPAELDKLEKEIGN